MGVEQNRFSSASTSPPFARHRNDDRIDFRRVTRQERFSSLADTQDPNANEGIYRHTGIPSIEISDAGDDRGLEANPFKADDHSAGPGFGPKGRTPSPNLRLRESFSGSKLAALKRKTYHVLSIGHEKGGDNNRDHEDGLLKAPLTNLACPSSGSPTWQRRAASMPVVRKQAHMDILHHADPVTTRSYLASGSPPIVDFTKFEDRYRSPSSDFDALFCVSKNGNGRKAMSSFALNGSEKPGKARGTSNWGSQKESGCGRVQVAGANEMVRNSSGRNVLYPADERKPDPRLVMDALDNTSEIVDIWGLLNVDDLLKMHDIDQQNLESRESKDSGEKVRKGRAGKTRTVFGELIQNVFRYASTTIILGEREYILPIVLVHCVEEIYRTGIYQPYLFRTLPNRPRLHELISIFDSEEQPPGSVIRSRQAVSSSLEGFGAATSLHLESTPDICALLMSYLSALPEPILPPDLFDAIWKLCEVDKKSHTDFAEAQPTPIPPSDSSAPVRLSSIPLTRSYTSHCEAAYMLIAQLLLHLLPSPHFFLFVYLLSFFSQVALVREENGVGIDDLAKMFGARLFGHGSGEVSSTKSSSTSKSRKARGKEKERNGRGEVMMVWFLRRWGPLSETLFEVVDDAKLGVLHRNKRMRKDSLGKAAMTSAYTAAREALGTHEAVESEIRDGQEDGERDDEGEDLVERELLDDGDVIGSVDLPEPVTVMGSPPTVHVPIAGVDLQEQGISSSVTFARKNRDLLPLPHGNVMSSGSVCCDGPQIEGSSHSSSGSSRSSSTPPPYTARPFPNIGMIEPDFNPSAVGCLRPDLVPTGRPEIRPDEGILPDDDHLYHSTPKKRNLSGRLLDLMNRSVDHTDHSDEKSCPSRVMASRQQDEEMPGFGAVNQSVGNKEGENAHPFSSLHERLLDVSMPHTIFDFDETMPVRDVNQASLLRTSPSSVTPTQGRAVIIERNLTPRISSTPKIPGYYAAPFSNSTCTLPLRPGLDRHRPSLNNTFLSLSSAPPIPAKSPGRTCVRSKNRLPVSRSQNQLRSTPAATIRNPGREKDTDAVTTSLRERLVEVEKERDEAIRIVTEVRRALRNVDAGSLCAFLS